MKSHDRTVFQGKSAEISYPLQWDSELVRDLIDENTDTGSRPAFLIVGKREAKMLRKHLGNAFGPAAVQCLKNIYYMGLQVVEDPSDSILCVTGRKSYGDRTPRKVITPLPLQSLGVRRRYSA